MIQVPRLVALFVAVDQNIAALEEVPFVFIVSQLRAEGESLAGIFYDQLVPGDILDGKKAIALLTSRPDH